MPTAADALLGAGHILAEQFSERAELRQQLREVLQRTGKLIVSQIGGELKPPAAPVGAGPSPAAAEGPDAARRSAEQAPGAEQSGGVESVAEPALAASGEASAAVEPGAEAGGGMPDGDTTEESRAEAHATLARRRWRSRRAGRT